MQKARTFALLGRPHLGADLTSNLLCLCPNHHTQLDYGGMVILDDLTIAETKAMTVVGDLRWYRAHKVDLENVRYHRKLWLPCPMVHPNTSFGPPHGTGPLLGWRHD